MSRPSVGIYKEGRGGEERPNDRVQIDRSGNERGVRETVVISRMGFQHASKRHNDMLHRLEDHNRA